MAQYTALTECSTYCYVPMLENEHINNLGTCCLETEYLTWLWLWRQVDCLLIEGLVVLLTEELVARPLAMAVR